MKSLKSNEENMVDSSHNIKINKSGSLTVPNFDICFDRFNLLKSVKTPD